MVQYNDNVDEEMKCCSLIEERILINNAESCKENININNNDNKLNKEDIARTILKRMYQCPNYFDDLSKLSYSEVRKQFETNFGKQFKDFPSLIQDAIIFGNFSHDNEESDITKKPDWFDEEKFIKGQAFARDNLAGLFLGQLYGLFCLICHEDGLKTLVLTKKSHTPYLAFNRYMSTSERIRNWYTEDPWSEGTKANKDIQMVRRMHRSVRRKLCELDYDEIDTIGTIKDPYCPAFSMIQKDFCTSLNPNTVEHFLYTEIGSFPNRPKSINQLDMSFTLFGFMGMVVIFPNEFGIYPKSDEDLENFCHVWRAIGYLLGVADEANFCRGSLEDVKQRSHEYLDLIVRPAFQHISPQWEHMSRCILEGFGYFFPSISFEVTMLRIADLMNIEMPGLYASLTYKEWIQYKFGKYFIRWGLRFAVIRNFCNRILNKIVDKAINVDKIKRAEIEEKSRNSMLHVA